MARIADLLTFTGVNGVPVAGWFVQHWSAGTTLTVYWIENVAACLFVAVRILTHQRVSPRRGHFRYRAPDGERSEGSFVKGVPARRAGHLRGATPCSSPSSSASSPQR